MFAHGYHFIAEQVKDAQYNNNNNNNNNNNQTTQKLTFSLQERILRLEKQSLAITRRILRNQLAALKVSFEDFYTNYYNDSHSSLFIFPDLFLDKPINF